MNIQLHMTPAEFVQFLADAVHARYGSLLQGIDVRGGTNAQVVHVYVDHTTQKAYFQTFSATVELIPVKP